MKVEGAAVTQNSTTWRFLREIFQKVVKLKGVSLSKSRSNLLKILKKFEFTEDTIGERSKKFGISKNKKVRDR